MNCDSGFDGDASVTPVCLQKDPVMNRLLLCVSLVLSVIAIALTLWLAFTVDRLVAEHVDEAVSANERASVQSMLPRVMAIYDDFEMPCPTDEPSTLAELLDLLFRPIEEVSGD